MNKLHSLGQAIKNIRQDNVSNAYFLYGNDIFMQDYFIEQFKKKKNTSQSYLYYLGYDQSETIFNELSKYQKRSNDLKQTIEFILNRTN